MTYPKPYSIYLKGKKAQKPASQEENEPRSQELYANTVFAGAAELEMLHLPCLQPVPLPRTLD